MNPQPVTVYLPVQLNRRGGKHRIEWWSASILKSADFTAADFQPFAVEERCDEAGVLHHFDFELAGVDTAKRMVVAKPYPVASSKSWPLERTLLGCGWKRCESPQCS